MSSDKNISEDVRWSGDSERVWCIAWSPDGTCLASCGSEHVVKIWEKMETWYCSSILEDIHTRTIRAVAWSPDGIYLAAASFDSTISIWERSGNEWQHVGLLEGHENEVKSVAWHPTRSLIATCGRDKTIWIWEVLSSYDYECVDVKQAHSQDVKMVKWHPHGMFLVSCSYDDSIKVWIEDIEEEWKCSQVLQSHTSTVWAIDFSLDGKEMVSCSDDLTFKIWIIQDPSNSSVTITLDKTLSGYHDRAIYSIALSPDRLIATGCGDDGIRIFREEESFEKEISLCCKVLPSHSSDVNCVIWNPQNPNQLASAGDDGEIRLWNIN